MANLAAHSGYPNLLKEVAVPPRGVEKDKAQVTQPQTKAKAKVKKKAVKK